MTDSLESFMRPRRWFPALLTLVLGLLVGAGLLTAEVVSCASAGNGASARIDLEYVTVAGTNWARVVQEPASGAYVLKLTKTASSNTITATVGGITGSGQSQSAEVRDIYLGMSSFGLTQDLKIILSAWIQHTGSWVANLAQSIANPVLNLQTLDTTIFFDPTPPAAVLNLARLPQAAGFMTEDNQTVCYRRTIQELSGHNSACWQDPESGTDPASWTLLVRNQAGAVLHSLSAASSFAGLALPEGSYAATETIRNRTGREARLDYTLVIDASPPVLACMASRKAVLTDTGEPVVPQTPPWALDSQYLVLALQVTDQSLARVTASAGITGFADTPERQSSHAANVVLRRTGGTYEAAGQSLGAGTVLEYSAGDLAGNQAVLSLDLAGYFDLADPVLAEPAVSNTVAFSANGQDLRLYAPPAGSADRSMTITSQASDDRLLESVRLSAIPALAGLPVNMSLDAGGNCSQRLPARTGGGVTVDTLADGIWELLVVAQDACGRQTSRTVKVMKDTAPPEILLNTNTSGLAVYSGGTQPDGSPVHWWTSPPAIAVQVQDALSGCTSPVPLLSLDRLSGGSLADAPLWSSLATPAWQASTGGVDFGTLGNGLYRLGLAASDRSGNSTQRFWYFCIDVTPPLIGWNWPAVVTAENGQLYSARNGSLELQLANPGGAGFESPLQASSGSVIVRLANGDAAAADGSAAASTGLSFTAASTTVDLALAGASLLDGRVSLRACARDGAGNQAWLTLVFQLDATAPVLTPGRLSFASAGSGRSEQLTASLAGPPVETGAGIQNGSWQLTVDNQSWPLSLVPDSTWRFVLDDAAGQGLIAGLAQGNHTVRISLRDRCGNQGSCVLNGLVDRSPPRIRITSLAGMDSASLSALSCGPDPAVRTLAPAGWLAAREVGLDIQDACTVAGQAVQSAITGFSALRVRQPGDHIGTLLDPPGDWTNPAPQGVSGFWPEGTGFRFNLIEGPQTLRFSATDDCGNTAVFWLTLQTDRREPLVSVQRSSVAGTIWSGNGSGFTAMATDQPVGQNAGLAESTWQHGLRAPGSDSQEPAGWAGGPGLQVGPASNQADGYWWFMARVSDGAGNSGTARPGLPLILDRSPPQGLSVSLPDRTGQTSWSVQLAAQDNSQALHAGLVESGVAGGFPGQDTVPVPLLGLQAWLDGTALSGAEYLVPGTSGFTGEFAMDLSGLAEGGHILSLALTDPAGNRTDWSGGFAVDRSPPRLDNISLSDPAGQAIPLDGYLPANQGRLQLDCSETYPVSETVPGRTAGCLEWYVAGRPDARVEEADSVNRQTFWFSRPDTTGQGRARLTVDFVSLPDMESTWLFFRLLDQAGNSSGASQPAVPAGLGGAGNWFCLQLHHDLGVFNPPVISSLSGLKEANRVADAHAGTDHSFLVVPGTVPRSGFRGYNLLLERLHLGEADPLSGVAALVGAPVRVSFDSQGREVGPDGRLTGLQLNQELQPGNPAHLVVRLTGLMDNDANGYYRLRAGMVSAAGVAGPLDSYQFRIDTTPPDTFALQMDQGTPLPDWQGSSLLACSWSDPPDLSGLEAFYWRIDPAGQAPDKAGFLAAGTPLDGWQRTLEHRLTIRLDTAGALESGPWILNLLAQDHAGNRRHAILEGNLDLRPPEFLQPGGQLTASPAARPDGVDLSFPPVLDLPAGSASGLRHLELTLYNLCDGTGLPERILVFDAADPALWTGEGAGTLHLGGLQSGVRYLARLVLADRAGNRLVTGTMFDQGIVDETRVSSLVQFTTLVAGFSHQGIQDLAGGGSRARCLPPDGLEFLEPLTHTPPGVWPEADQARRLSDGLELGPRDLVFDTSGLVAWDRDFGLQRLARTCGWLVAFSRAELSGADGLVLADGAIRLPGAPGSILQLGRVRAGKGDCRSLDSAWTPLGAALPVWAVNLPPGPGVAAESWMTGAVSLSGIDRVRLDSACLRLGTARLDLQAVAARHRWTIQGNLNCRDLLLSADSDLVSADFSGASLEIQTGLASHRILSGRLQGPELLVTASEFTWFDGVSQHTLNLGNYVVNLQTGTFAQQGGWQTSAWGMGYGHQTRLEADRISLLPTGRLGVDGRLCQADGQALSGFSGLILGQGGPDWLAPPVLDSLVMLCHGFRLTGSDQYLMSQGILIRSGTLRLQGTEVPCGGLVVDSLAQQILEPGWFDPGNSGLVWTCSYPDPVRVHSGSIEPLGVFAPLSVTLPAIQAPAWIDLSRARLEPAAIRADATTLEPQAAWALDMAGWPVLASQAVFDGRQLSFGRLVCSWTEASGRREVVLGGLVHGQDGTTVATTGTPVATERPGTGLVLGNFRLGPRGLSATLDLAGSPWCLADGSQASLGRQYLDPAWPAPDGSWTSGFLPHDGQDGATEPAILPLYGWAVQAPAARFQRLTGGLAIQADSCSLTVVPGDAGTTLACGPLVLDLAGRVLQATGGQSGGLPLAIDLPGYAALGLAAWEPGPEGLRLTGQVSLELENCLGGRDVVTLAPPANSLCLSPALGLSSAVLAGPWPASLADWQVSLGQIRFSPDGVSLGRLDFAPPLDGLGPVIMEGLAYSADGSLAVPARLSQATTLVYLGWPVSLEDGQFGPGGMVFSGRIDLPESLGGQAIALESLVVGADGALSTALALSHFSLQTGGLQLELENLAWSPAGLGIDRATLVLPEALQSVRVSLDQLFIDPDGGLSIASLQAAPVELFGLTFCLDQLSIDGGTVSASGAVVLPDSFPGDLAGLRLALDRLRFTSSGELLECSVRLDRTFRFELFEGYAVSATRLGFDWDHGLYLCLDQAALDFPPDIPVGRVAVNGLRIRVEDGLASFDDIVVNNVCLDFDGLTFQLTEGRFSQDGTLSFAGQVALAGTGLAALDGLCLEIRRFEILPGGRIGCIDGSLAIPDFDLSAGLRVISPSVGIARNAQGRFFAGLSGALELSASYPQGIAGTRLVLDEFLVSVSDGCLVALRAHNDPVSFDLPGGPGFRNLALSVSLGDGTGRQTDTTALLSGGRIAARGTMVLPESFPQAFRGAQLALAGSSFNLAGGVEELSASLDLPGSRAMGGGVWITDARLGLEIRQGTPLFRATGSLQLDNSFPQGLAGSRLSLRQCTFNADGSFDELDAALSLGAFQLGGNLPVRNAGLGVRLDDRGRMEFGLSGELILPASFPEGLAGSVLAIQEFRINQEGGISALSIGLSGLSCRLFGALELSQGCLQFSQVQNELVLGVSGKLALPDSLPDGLAGTTLEIADFRISASRGIQACSLSLTTGLEFEIYAGIKAAITRLSCDLNGFNLAGCITLPDAFPQGLGGLVLVLDRFSLDWNGQIRDIAAGIGQAGFTVAGFACEVRRLLVGPAGVSLESASITLPPGLGQMSGARLGLRNAGLDTAGRFHGEFVVPDISLDLAGFTLRFVGPGIDLEHQCLSFDRALLVLPEVLGRTEFAVSGISLAATGASIQGLSVTLPDFEIPGGLQFKGIGITVELKDDDFLIKGKGAAYLPGGGGFAAAVSFCKPSAVWPVGLRQAWFEYTLTSPGLPIASTGLYLTAMRGGMAFGPPDEVPAAARWLFRQDQGVRLQLGLTLADGTRNLVEGKVDTWVDVQNFAWAIQGQVTFLKSTLNISANILAAVSAKGFYAGVNVVIVFIEGRMDFYIFDENQQTLVSATGSVSVFIPEKIILGFYPFARTKLLEVGMEAGTFSNGKVGARGYVELPIIGRLWVFMDQNGMATEGIAEYRLRLPAGLAPQASLGSGAPGPAGPQVSQLAGPSQATGSLAAAGSPAVPGSGANLPGTSCDVTWTLETLPEMQNLVLALEWGEGVPDLELLSPDGRRYTPDSPGVAAESSDRSLIMGLSQPVSGCWSVRLRGLLAEAGYNLRAFGVPELPSISLEVLADDLVWTDAGLHLAGQSSVAEATIEVRAVEDGSSHPGWFLGRTRPDGRGGWSLELTPGGLPEGRYRLQASLTADRSGMTARCVSAGHIVVRSEAELLPPQEVQLAWLSADSLLVEFSEPNGRRALDHDILIERGQDQTGRWWPAGPATSFIYPVPQEPMDPAPGPDVRRLTVRLRSRDARGRVGPASAPVTIPCPDGVPAAAAGQARLLPAAPIRLSPGSSTTVLARLQGGAPGARYLVRPAATKHVGLLLAQAPATHACGELVPLTIKAPDRMAPGEWNIGIELVPAGEWRQPDTCSLPVVVAWPLPVINRLSPDSCTAAELTADAVELVIQGSGFASGSRVSCAGRACEVTAADPGALRCKLPAGLGVGRQRIVVQGPDGAEAEAWFQVTNPGWQVAPVRSRLAAAPGQTASLTFRFTSQGAPGARPQVQLSSPAAWLQFQAQDQGPASHPARAPVRQTGSLAEQEEWEIWQIRIAADCPPGSYRLDWRVMDGAGTGGQATAGLEPAPEPVILQVGTNRAPAIAGLSGRSFLPGEEFVVYGDSLGPQDDAVLQARVGRAEWPIISQALNSIVVRVPDQADSGDFRLERRTAAGELMATEAWPVFVRHSSLELRVPTRRFRVRGNHTLAIPVSVQFAGQAGIPVQVQTLVRPGSSCPGQAIPAALPLVSQDLEACSQPGVLNLTVNPGAAPAGRYELLVTGRLGTLVQQLVLDLELLDQAVIQTGSLAEAEAGRPYRQVLAASGLGAGLVWQVAAGQLPPGLDLSASGIISGLPQETGTWVMTLAVQDQAGLAARRELELSVQPGAWTCARSDPGRTNAFPAMIPMADQTVWQVRVPEACDLLTAPGLVFVRSPDQIQALDGTDGTLLWCRNIRARDWFHGFGCLFVLDETGTLSALDEIRGGVRWSRPGIRGMRADAGHLALWGPTAWHLLEPATGRERLLDLPPFMAGDSIWVGGVLHGWAGSTLYRLAAGGLETWLETPGPIDQVVGDAAGLALVLAGYELLLLDPEGQPVDRYASPSPIVELALDPAVLALGSGSQTCVRSRSAPGTVLELPCQAVVPFSQAYVGRQDRRLAVFNRQTGQAVWSHEFAAIPRLFVPSGNDLLALLADGTIQAFRGAANLEAPRSRVNPGASQVPVNGWYREPLQPRIQSRDRETRTVCLDWKYAPGDWTQSVMQGDTLDLPRLAEGQHTLVYRGRDSQGLAEDFQVWNVRIDTTPPVLAAQVADSTGSGSITLCANHLDHPAVWLNRPGLVCLQATDALSGVEALEARLGDGPWAPLEGDIPISREGLHQVQARVRDLAGNWQELAWTIGLDTTRPQAELALLPHPRGGRLNIQPRDGLSGIGEVVCAIDQGPAVPWPAEMVLEPGWHHLAVQVIDRAGNRLVLDENLYVPVPDHQHAPAASGIRLPEPDSRLINDGRPLELALVNPRSNLVTWYWKVLPATLDVDQAAGEGLPGQLDGQAEPPPGCLDWQVIDGASLLLPRLGRDWSLWLLARETGPTGTVLAEHQASYRLLDPVRLVVPPGLAQAGPAGSWLKLASRGMSAGPDDPRPVDVVWEQAGPLGDYEALPLSPDGLARVPEAGPPWKLRARWPVGTGADGRLLFACREFVVYFEPE